MSEDKHSNKIASDQNSAPPWNDGSNDRLPYAKSQACIIIKRAAITYGVLFLIFALILSFLDVDPLARNGLMPKALLVFVGLAMLIALANNLVDYSRERGISWLGLARNLLRATFKNPNAKPQKPQSFKDF